MAKGNQNKHEIARKIIIHATITNISPLLIGKGSGEAVDIELVKLPNGMVYIPGSSIAGVIKRFMLANGLTKEGTYLWGRMSDRWKETDDSIQSHVIISDMVPTAIPEKSIGRRDGVKISHQMGTAEENMKYDYEILEPGTEFPFYAELTIRRTGEVEKGKANCEALQFATNLKSVFNSEAFRIGAFSNTGFGQIKCTAYEAFEFEFPAHSEAWFTYLEYGRQGLSLTPINLERVDDIKLAGQFVVKGAFRLKTSLMIGSYGIKSTDPDKSQLKSGEDFALPGKSIRGALRHRASKILSALVPQVEASERIKDLFGEVNEEQKTQKRGRIRVDESIMKKEEVQPMLQNRVRIDRFTGGAIDSALFNSQPVWTTEKEKIAITLTIHTNASAWDRRLLLLLLKDLWLEDLPIGGEKNVGRGILIGEAAEIIHEGETIAIIERNNSGGIVFKNQNERERLEQLINVLTH